MEKLGGRLNGGRETSWEAASLIQASSSGGLNGDVTVDIEIPEVKATDLGKGRGQR